MNTIEIQIKRADVYEEVAKATDYTGSKVPGDDGTARDRILAADDDLRTLWRMWDEAVTAVNESLKSMLVDGRTNGSGNDAVYEATLEVSVAYDRALTGSVYAALRGFLIANIIGQWFKFANKSEAADYFATADEMLAGALRLLYSRRRPTLPTN